MSKEYESYHQDHLIKLWNERILPTFNELQEIMAGKSKLPHVQIVFRLNARRDDDQTYNPVLTLLARHSAKHLGIAYRKMSPDDRQAIDNLLKKHEERWHKLCEDCIIVYGDLGNVLYRRYCESLHAARNLLEKDSPYHNNVCHESFERLCESIDAIASEESRDPHIAAPGIATMKCRKCRKCEKCEKANADCADIILEPPDLASRPSCRQFCHRLYTEVRDKLKTRIHSDTQAVDYILDRAKKGDLFYNDCLLARQIRRDLSWSRDTFKTYSKQKNAPTPKTLKRAAKKRRYIKTVMRELHQL